MRSEIGVAGGRMDHQGQFLEMDNRGSVVENAIRRRE